MGVQDQESHDHTDLPSVTDSVTRPDLCGNSGLMKISHKDFKGGWTFSFSGRIMVLWDSGWWLWIWIDRRSVNAIKIIGGRYIGLLRDKACDDQVAWLTENLTSFRSLDQLPQWIQLAWQIARSGKLLKSWNDNFTQTQLRSYIIQYPWVRFYLQ